MDPQERACSGRSARDNVLREFERSWIPPTALPSNLLVHPVTPMRRSHPGAAPPMPFGVQYDLITLCGGHFVPATCLVFHAHFLGMLLSNALASMRLMSDEPPALHAARPTPVEHITAPEV